jgi:uncharacterized protein YfkK (UPF0435 family)
MKKFTQTDLNETEGLYDSRQDRWSRRAKRHFSQAELRNLENSERVFEERETVIYQNTEVKVKIPEGPRQTVGILFEGKLKMVAKSDLTKLDEMVMGMTSLSPINRMMQLAGVEPKEIVTEELDQLQQKLYHKLDNAITMTQIGRATDMPSDVKLHLQLTLEEARYLCNKIAPNEIH